MACLLAYSPLFKNSIGKKMNLTPSQLSSLNIFELRQYTLHPHKRDVLIDLFDREFLETQDAVGMPVLGQFRDMDDADQFVWMRGFASMPARYAALSDFYGGPVWQAHREAANTTMIDSDNVLLLRPAWQGAAFPVDLNLRADKSAVKIPKGCVDLTIFHLNEEASAILLEFCQQHMAQVLRAGGALNQGWYITEPSENTFPRLPVRTGESVLVGIALFEDEATYQRFGVSGIWQQKIAPQLQSHLAKPNESHRLAPTARSPVHA
jgi:NIPSNAP